MAIANPVQTKAVTLGATTMSLEKVADGKYSYVNPTGQIPTTLTIKESALGAKNLRVSLTLKRNHGILDAFPDHKAGSISATFQLNGSLGTAVTRDVMQDFAVEFASLVATPALIDALLAGSLE